MRLVLYFADAFAWRCAEDRLIDTSVAKRPSFAGD